MKMKIAKLTPTATVPTKGSAEAAGWDLYLDGTPDYRITIDPKDMKWLHTGVAMEIPKGYYGRIAPRSGLAAKYGADVLGGVIDSDYRGELVVMLMILGPRVTTLKAGDRIAQLVIEKYADDIELQVVTPDELSRTERGAGGQGSTGR